MRAKRGHPTSISARRASAASCRAHVRFQVCLPTPMGVIYAFCMPRDLLAIDAAYETGHDPRGRNASVAPFRTATCCIQWDFCHEMIIWDGQPQDMFPLVKASKDEIMARMARICAPCLRPVELGFHLCYGDFGAKHFIEPRDAAHDGRGRERARAERSRTRSPTSICRCRWSAATTAISGRCRILRLAPRTELYLGLVHAADGAEGTRRRIEVARRYVNGFRHRDRMRHGAGKDHRRYPRPAERARRRVAGAEPDWPAPVPRAACGRSGA